MPRHFGIYAQEELDRREQQIESLTKQISELQTLTSAMKQELHASNEESQRYASELDKLRVALNKDDAREMSAEVHRLERRVRELQEKTDAQRVSLDRWEHACLEEKALREELESKLNENENLRTSDHEREKQFESLLQQERNVSRQLHEALEEMQQSQDRDLQRSVGDMQEKMEVTEAELERTKLQLHDMEVRISQSCANSRCN